MRKGGLLKVDKDAAVDDMERNSLRRWIDNLVSIINKKMTWWWRRATELKEALRKLDTKDCIDRASTTNHAVVTKYADGRVYYWPEAVLSVLLLLKSMLYM